MCHVFLDSPPRPRLNRNTGSSAGALLAPSALGAVFDDIRQHAHATAPAHAVVAAPAPAAHLPPPPSWPRARARCGRHHAADRGGRGRAPQACARAARGKVDQGDYSNHSRAGRRRARGRRRGRGHHRRGCRCRQARRSAAVNWGWWILGAASVAAIGWHEVTEHHVVRIVLRSADRAAPPRPPEPATRPADPKSRRPGPRARSTQEKKPACLCRRRRSTRRARSCWLRWAALRRPGCGSALA
jgi:hypothetical protein